MHLIVLINSNLKKVSNSHLHDNPVDPDLQICTIFKLIWAHGSFVNLMWMGYIHTNSIQQMMQVIIILALISIHVFRFHMTFYSYVE